MLALGTACMEHAAFCVSMVVAVIQRRFKMAYLFSAVSGILWCCFGRLYEPDSNASGRFKTIYDCTSCAVAVILSFLFFGLGQFKGINVGTVICSLLKKEISWPVKFWIR